MNGAMAPNRRRHADIDDDRVGIDRRLVRDVKGIPQQQLQGVLAFWQSDGGLRLAAAEMQMVVVARNWLVQWR